jgi:hypothetical protein
MLKTTLGQVLINQALPPKFRDYRRVLDKRSVATLMTQIAEQQPEEYRDIAKRLSDVGRDAAYSTGGQSFGLQSLRQTVAGRRARYELQVALDKLYRRKLPREATEAETLRLLGKYQKTLADEVLEEATAADNPLARQLKGAGRGNKFSLNSLLGADLLYTDHRGHVVPIPVLRSYSQGLRPHEYMAGAFGARKGVVDLKTATSKAGFLSKQLVQSAHRLIVTAQDDETPYDAESPRGYVVDTNDADNEGAFLAHAVGGYPRNTELTPKILRELRNAGHEKLLVRSPLVGGPEDGGVYGRDVGRREKGLAPVGDYVGIAAVQSLCLAEGTQVRMADGSEKPIEAVRAGDMVLGCDQTGTVRPVAVLDWRSSGLKECVRAVFRYGGPLQRTRLELVATPEHKILSEIVVLEPRAVASPPSYLSTRAVRPLGTEYDKTQYRFCAIRPRHFDDTGLHREPQAQILGLRADTEPLPATINVWDNVSVAAFLAGLLAMRGLVNEDRIEFRASSPALLVAVRQLLQTRFGVWSGAVGRGVGRSRPVYRFAVRGTAQLQRLAGELLLLSGQQHLLRDVVRQKPAHDIHSRCTLLSREPAGVLQTYDIFVEHPDHLFMLANGLVVSNSEPLTQGQISSKHTGGIAGAAGSAAISGFKYISQLIQVPKHFPGGATHAQLDGKVGHIREAPQGGYYVPVGDKEHYVAPGFDLQVKPGAVVEAGDTLSNGIPNPAEIVKHKGVGEGRVYFVKQFRNALADAGIRGHRRNIELLARGLLNHVRLTDEVGDWGPDDVVPYQLLERNWRPRAGHIQATPQSALGKYLERPILHYSVGTRIQPSMLPTLQQFGVKKLLVHNEPPPFEPEFIRGMANVSMDPDWMTRMLGSYQQKSLLRGAQRGAVSDEAGTSYVPTLASGLHFGKVGPTKGWKPADLEQKPAGQPAPYVKLPGDPAV